MYRMKKSSDSSGSEDFFVVLNGRIGPVESCRATNPVLSLRSIRPGRAQGEWSVEKGLIERDTAKRIFCLTRTWRFPESLLLRFLMAACR